MTLQELREKRAKLITDARAIYDKAEAEKRSATAEERTRFDTMFNDAANIKADVENRERLAAIETELNTSTGRRSEHGDTESRIGGAGGTRNGETFVTEYRGHRIEIKPGERGYYRTTEEYTNNFRHFLRTGERRTAASFANDVDADGGYLHASEMFVAKLIKAIDNTTFVRRRATVFPVTSSDSLGAPSLTTDVSDADWQTEVATITPDAAAQLGTRALVPYLSTKAVTVSGKLLMTAALNPETLVIDRLSYKFGITEEKAYLTGDGSAKPLGVFTASANGVPTSRDFSTGNTATAMTFDGLLNAKYGLVAAHRAGATWCFHRDGVSQVAKIKDANGQYVWQASKAQGEPDMLLGHPIDESEYAPNTFTTGLYVGIFADWSNYWIADLRGLEIQRLIELLALKNQVAFVGKKYTDGAPVLATAFARVKLG